MSIKILMILIASLAHAGEKTGSGGSLVGNGAGLVEQNVFFAYQSLGKAVEDCLFLEALCGPDAAEKRMLRLVQKLQGAYPASAERIQFLSGAAHPGFFDTAPGESHRVARTELTPGATIYFNTDILYAPNGQPALDLAAIYAILVHELGHQTGEPDHASLDRLGAKLRAFFQTRVQQLRSSEMNVSLQLINYSARTGKAELYFHDDGDAYALTRLLEQGAGRCRDGLVLLGWKLENLHWRSFAQDDGRGGKILPFSVWMRKSCVRLGGEGPALLEEQVSPLDFQLFFSPDRVGDLHFREAKLRSNDE